MSVMRRGNFYKNTVKTVGLRKFFVDHIFEIFTKAKTRDRMACQVEKESKVMYNLSVQLNQHDCPKRKKRLISKVEVLLAVYEGTDSNTI